ncbi:MAG: class I SAM-dependent methyltransferase [Bacteroides sp.]|nr:class I SAM-dependent methyltransferase [Bacteroides sp.]
MKENKYDDNHFFEQYSQMSRSVNGLEGAGEWHVLQKMLPDFTGKRLLDLGCGFGWHCKYAMDHGAKSALGIDISENMLARARVMNAAPGIEYLGMPLEDYSYPQESFDIVISSLTFHYIQSFEDMCSKIKRTLVPGGSFVFSVEHPVFTAYGNQDWYYNEKGEKQHWPVDRYFMEGYRKALFLGEEVVKYHKTLTTYIHTLLQQGFELKELIEPQPSEQSLEAVPEMKDELRRPMMLIISAIRR